MLITKNTDFNYLSAVKFMLDRDISIVIADAAAVKRQIDLVFHHSHEREVEKDAGESPPAAPNHSVIGLVDNLILRAVSLSASDIHLEPFENFMAVRFRIDGILRPETNIKKNLIPAVVSRIKILSGLDIAEKRRPQDGRLRFAAENRTIDIRVSVLPTDFGEKIALRLLDKSSLKLGLNSLGFQGDDLQLFKKNIELPNGIVLITGPTGSGKTTTLYAALDYIKSADINITTIENPIEYNIEGVNQTQIKPEIDLTFASSLKAILRQDPDVIMIGEIRDRETLQIALRASLTGHLVFSTVHTNDSISTVARLVDLGAKGYLLAPGLKLIVAQRLVRKICPYCKTDDISPQERQAAARLNLPGHINVQAGTGCARCLSIGFRGRTAIYEMLPIDNEIAKIILNSDDRHEIMNVLEKRGLPTLRDKGIALIKSGITTPSEILRETT